MHRIVRHAHSDNPPLLNTGSERSFLSIEKLANAVETSFVADTSCFIRSSDLPVRTRAHTNTKYQYVVVHACTFRIKHALVCAIYEVRGLWGGVQALIDSLPPTFSATTASQRAVTFNMPR